MVVELLGQILLEEVPKLVLEPGIKQSILKVEAGPQHQEVEPRLVVPQLLGLEFVKEQMLPFQQPTQAMEPAYELRVVEVMEANQPQLEELQLGVVKEYRHT